MMLNLSAALGRLVLSGRELARLSGFSSRVTGLIDAIDDVNRGVYKRGRKANVPGNTKTAGAATGGVQSTTAVAAAAAEAAAEAQIAEQARETPSRRNAGVAGVNLATDHTPRWTAARRKTAPPGVGVAPATIDPAVSSDTILETVSARPATEIEATGVATPNVAAEGTAVSGRLETRTLSSGAGGQPELAPEAGAAGAVAKVGVGRVGEGGERLARSGSVLVNEESVIEFTDVPLVTPTGEVLIEALSFKARQKRTQAARCLGGGIFARTSM